MCTKWIVSFVNAQVTCLTGATLDSGNGDSGGGGGAGGSGDVAAALV